MSAGSANTDALFDRELKKYDTLRADVAANVGRNAELLAAISRDAQVCGSCCSNRTAQQSAVACLLAEYLACVYAALQQGKRYFVT
jgi:hypothetical protein